MDDSAIKSQAFEQTQSPEGQELMSKYLETSTPVLANARGLIYKAYKRPYAGGSGTDVLVLLANGWYFPTPKVDLYFEYFPKEDVYKLWQNNSSVTFSLVTYHNAEWTSGAGLINVGSSVKIQDANGIHTVTIEEM